MKISSVLNRLWCQNTRDWFERTTDIRTSELCAHTISDFSPFILSLKATTPLKLVPPRSRDLHIAIFQL